MCYCVLGIQFLPLDKYVYLKVHCFVNLVETTYRYISQLTMCLLDVYYNVSLCTSLPETFRDQCSFMETS